MLKTTRILEDLDGVDLHESLPVDLQNVVVRTLRDVSLYVVHHSATPITTTATQISRYHRNYHEWPSIGYHYVIYPNGTIAYTLSLAYVGYHTASPKKKWGISEANWNGVGICLVGNFVSGHRPFPRQLNALTKLCCALDQYFRRVNGESFSRRIAGHREAGYPTLCPGEQHHSWLDPVVERVNSVFNGKDVLT